MAHRGAKSCTVGILAGLMRFVPFVGAFIAAFFPIALAAAVDPGWSMVAMTVALFVISEPLVGHVIEPVLYSQHAGLSPVAIVVSSLFWTMLCVRLAFS
jgi:predicted PurR-regulated permease PerM